MPLQLAQAFVTRAYINRLRSFGNAATFPEK